MSFLLLPTIITYVYRGARLIRTTLNTDIAVFRTRYAGPAWPTRYTLPRLMQSSACNPDKNALTNVSVLSGDLCTIPKCKNRLLYTYTFWKRTNVNTHYYFEETAHSSAVVVTGFTPTEDRLIIREKESDDFSTIDRGFGDTIFLPDAARPPASNSHASHVMIKSVNQPALGPVTRSLAVRPSGWFVVDLGFSREEEKKVTCFSDPRKT